MTWCEKTANAQLSLQPWSRVAWMQPLPSGALSTYLSHGSWVFRLSVHRGHRVPGPLDPWPQTQWLCVFTTGATKARVSFCPRVNAKCLISSYLGSLEKLPWNTEASGGWMRDAWKGSWIRVLGACTVGSLSSTSLAFLTLLCRPP